MITPITDGNFHIACTLWVQDPSSATSTYGNIIGWDTSSVTNMSYAFKMSSFNDDISNWDTSNVINMRAMFFFASMFNQDISSWNVSNVKDMTGMFLDASLFNSDISSWDVSNVTNMTYAFYNASNFNRDIRNWTVKQTTIFTQMFKGATQMIATYGLELYFGTSPDYTPTYMFFPSYIPTPAPLNLCYKKLCGVNQKEAPGLARTLNMNVNKYNGSYNRANNTLMMKFN